MYKHDLLSEVIECYEKEQRAREERIRQEIKAGLRILVEINGKRVYATKAEVIEAIKDYKTVRRIKVK